MISAIGFPIFELFAIGLCICQFANESFLARKLASFWPRKIEQNSQKFKWRNENPNHTIEMKSNDMWHRAKSNSLATNSSFSQYLEFFTTANREQKRGETGQLKLIQIKFDRYTVWLLSATISHKSAKNGNRWLFIYVEHVIRLPMATKKFVSLFL